MNYSEDKFKSLIHYVCASCEDVSQLGATKLNKILWYSDVISYLKHGSPITGETYLKRQFGPVPSRVMSALNSLSDDKLITVRRAEHFGYPKKEFISLKTPDVSEVFSSDEIELIDEVVHKICNNYTATSISDKTHDEIWEMAKIGESIPYEAVLVSQLGEVDEHDMSWAEDEAKDIAA
ncbi:SocA family protein [Endozoicomonas sp. G2_2]|uniref:Panacea domain-containing protein n=1 Tax=Endozoicomonas sp. G2_2 TaxID=2821092 RepID=UPI001ADD0B68|nr:Panacea domain-containing protein [Endozoicomonas sp. G2_2]MBO9471716.1 SocA family protein [Endozoicomonas sp. G2_2]